MAYNQRRYLHRLLPRKFVLGGNYLMIGKTYERKVRLIQPTLKGFNFLNLETNKCVFKNHLYPSTAQNHQNTSLPSVILWVSRDIILEENVEKVLNPS